MNVVKTFVKVDKRLKKGVKSHGIWASSSTRDAFLQGHFFIPPVKRCGVHLPSRAEGFGATLFWLSNAYVNIH
ncbi:TPA: hypothetical protein MBD98_002803 [Klebsiella aerogenes]|nr:hypothetical protein CRN78_18605 [Klebsiella aerogenes]ATX88765.1 hypothetical protein AM345_18455 [Klebsiella aerogenes]ATY01682.1 hypothetical protein AM334_13190 [Klebsiella aerogenes]ATY04077.1 hypothetical protein AM336_00145 [Klebsiella aerogenes]AUY88998.1 hypothetical protein AL497_24850 [Klebsiella aerogenes]